MSDVFDQLRIGLERSPRSGRVESLVYRPRAGGTRSISGIVDREPLQPLPPTSQALGPLAHVHVKNDATTGIASTELDTGGDAIDIPVRLGDSARTWEITRIVAHDDASLQLEVR